MSQVPTQEQMLREALSLALGLLAPLEPSDSRAVSDEFVAMSAVLIGQGDHKCVDVIRKAATRIDPANHPVRPASPIWAVEFSDLSAARNLAGLRPNATEIFIGGSHVLG